MKKDKWTPRDELKLSDSDSEALSVSRAFGTRIRKLRTERKISQEKAAFDANIHPSYYGCIERGEKCPTIDTLYKISASFGISLSSLLDIPEFSACDSSEDEQLSDIDIQIKRYLAEADDMQKRVVLSVLKTMQE